ncbi:unnamed protein product [Rotaria sp. Silwood1]|nr:unnamed protein product [Rotaria sp. Silwood1]
MGPGAGEVRRPGDDLRHAGQLVHRAGHRRAGQLRHRHLPDRTLAQLAEAPPGCRHRAAGCRALHRLRHVGPAGVRAHPGHLRAAAAAGRAGWRAAAGLAGLRPAGGHRHPVGRHHPGDHDHPVHRLGHPDHHAEVRPCRRAHRHPAGAGPRVRRDGAAAVHGAVQPVLDQRRRLADGQPAGHHLQVRDEPLRELAEAGLGRRLPDHGRRAAAEHPRPRALQEQTLRNHHGRQDRNARGRTRQAVSAQPELLLRQLPRAEERQPRHSREQGHRLHRPVGLRQVHAAAHAEPHVRALPRTARRRRDPAGRRKHPREQGRRLVDPRQGRHGLPEAHALPDVHLRQHRVRREAVRDAATCGDGRACRVGPEEGRAVDRGEGQAQPERLRPLRRPAAAAVHRAWHRHQARGAAARRALLGAGPDLHRQDRGTDPRTEERLHRRHRDPQHAAGRTLLRLHGLHVPRRPHRIRPYGRALHEAQAQGHRGLHHRPPVAPADVGPELRGRTGNGPAAQGAGLLRPPGRRTRAGRAQARRRDRQGIRRPAAQAHHLHDGRPAHHLVVHRPGVRRQGHRARGRPRQEPGRSRHLRGQGPGRASQHARSRRDDGLDEAHPVQAAGDGQVGRAQGAVVPARPHRRLLLRLGREGAWFHPEHPWHRHPHAGPARRHRRGGDRHRRPDGHRRRHQLPARRARQLRHPGTAADPVRRHRAAHRPQRPAGAAEPRGDRQPVVTVVGRDDDGRRCAGVAAGSAGDLCQRLQAPRQGGQGRRQERPAEGHRGAAVDLLGRRACCQPAGLLGDACLLRRAAVAVHRVAAADLRADGDLHQLDGADVVDADRRAVQDHAVFDGRAGPQQPRLQPAAGRHDGRGGGQRGQPAVRHQARLHAGRQAAPPGHRTHHRQPGRRVVQRAAVLPAVRQDRRGRRGQRGGHGVRPVRLPGGAAVEGRGRHHRQGHHQPADVGADLGGCGGRHGRRHRGGAHRHQGPLGPVRRGHRPGRRAAAAGHHHDVHRRAAVLAPGSPAQDARHERSPHLGGRHGADLRRSDLRCGADWHRRRHHQRVDLTG